MILARFAGKIKCYDQVTNPWNFPLNVRRV